MLTSEKVSHLRRIISEPGYYTRRYCVMLLAATHYTGDSIYSDMSQIIYKGTVWYDQRFLKRAEWYKHKIDLTMCNTKISTQDCTTFKAGLFLQETRYISPFRKIKIWNLQFVAPSAHAPLSVSAVHTIQHIFTAKLKELIGNKFIGFYPCGSKTRFVLISKSSLNKERLIESLITLIEHTNPILKRDEIPGLTAEECCNPKSFAIKETNTALSQYLAVLKSIA